MEYVCVYCGSSSGSSSAYDDAIAQFAAELVERDIGLVYGGANGGVMGALADAVLDGGGEVIGIIPETILDREQPHESLTELIVTESKDERKRRMSDLADGFVALPGGLGTQEELFQMLGQAKHGVHGKPCGYLNVAGYYDSLVAFLDHAVEEGFVSADQRGLALVEERPDALLDAFETYSSPFVDPDTL
ncbi:TIGR00730 family Rossman fold protein [Natrialbaceae archaeon A-arb3/5]